MVEPLRIDCRGRAHLQLFGRPRRNVDDSADGIAGVSRRERAVEHIDAVDLFRRHLPASRAPFALRVDERFDFVRQPFYEPNGPGMNLDLQPDDYRLRDVVDAYIYLGVARGIERRR